MDKDKYKELFDEWCRIKNEENAEAGKRTVYDKNKCAEYGDLDIIHTIFIDPKMIGKSNDEFIVEIKKKINEKNKARKKEPLLSDAARYGIPDEREEIRKDKSLNDDFVKYILKEMFQELRRNKKNRLPITIFRMKILKQRTNTEIALKLGLNNHAVANHLNVAKGLIQNILIELGYFYELIDILKIGSYRDKLIITNYKVLWKNDTNEKAGLRVNVAGITIDSKIVCYMPDNLTKYKLQTNFRISEGARIQINEKEIKSPYEIDYKKPNTFRLTDKSLHFSNEEFHYNLDVIPYSVEEWTQEFQDYFTLKHCLQFAFDKLNYEEKQEIFKKSLLRDTKKNFFQISYSEISKYYPKFHQQIRKNILDQNRKLFNLFEHEDWGTKLFILKVE